MEVSKHTIDFLGRFIAGDLECMPYRTGPQLIQLFNSFGERDVYPEGGGFQTRRIYAKNKAKKFNGTKKLTKLIEKVLNPHMFIRDDLNHIDAVNKINEVIKHDGYRVVTKNHKAKIISSKDRSIEVERIATDNKDIISIIEDNIEKCNDKLENGDYSGAITNARSLVESVLLSICSEYEECQESNIHNILQQYKNVQKHLNLSPGRTDIDNVLKQVLTGLSSIVNGIAATRNKMSDAHATTYKAYKHHAKLIVRSAITIVDFLFETKEYQKEKGIIQ